MPFAAFDTSRWRYPSLISPSSCRTPPPDDGQISVPLKKNAPRPCGSGVSPSLQKRRSGRGRVLLPTPLEIAGDKKTGVWPTCDRVPRLRALALSPSAAQPRSAHAGGFCPSDALRSPLFFASSCTTRKRHSATSAKRSRRHCSVSSSRPPRADRRPRAQQLSPARLRDERKVVHIVLDHPELLQRVRVRRAADVAALAALVVQVIRGHAHLRADGRRRRGVRAERTGVGARRGRRPGTLRVCDGENSVDSGRAPPIPRACPCSSVFWHMSCSVESTVPDSAITSFSLRASRTSMPYAVSAT